MVMGMRTCLHCPHCSMEERFDYYTAATRSHRQSTVYSNCGMMPCQIKFGRNARVFGGTYGLADGLCCATEHQGNDTPHAHGVFSPATPYRNKTLEDIKHLITDQICTPDAIKRYVAHMCREEHSNLERHEASLEQVEKMGLNNMLAPHTFAWHSGLPGRRQT